MVNCIINNRYLSKRGQIRNNFFFTICELQIITVLTCWISIHLCCSAFSHNGGIYHKITNVLSNAVIFSVVVITNDDVRHHLHENITSAIRSWLCTISKWFSCQHLAALPKPDSRLIRPYFWGCIDVYANQDGYHLPLSVMTLVLVHH